MGDGRLVITRLNRSMVATFEGAIDAGELGDLVNSLFEAQARQNVDSVVFEVSACEVMDLDEFAVFAGYGSDDPDDFLSDLRPKKNFFVRSGILF